MPSPTHFYAARNGSTEDSNCSRKTAAVSPCTMLHIASSSSASMFSLGTVTNKVSTVKTSYCLS